MMEKIVKDQARKQRQFFQILLQGQGLTLIQLLKSRPGIQEKEPRGTVKKSRRERDPEPLAMPSHPSAQKLSHTLQEHKSNVSALTPKAVPSPAAESCTSTEMQW